MYNNDTKDFSLEHLTRDSPFRQDGIKQYMDWLYKIRLLTPEEVETLARMKDRGSLRAKNTLIRHNLRLVVSVAKKYAGAGIPFVDLIQEGNLGLIKAIEKYDINKQYSITTYAHWWIKQAISAAITNHSDLRLPQHMTAKVKAVKEAEKLIRRTGKEPTVEDIHQLTYIKPTTIDDILQGRYKASISLDSDRINDKGIVPRKGQYEMDCYEQHILEEEIAKALEELHPKERLIIMYRFGLFGEKRLTLREIGQIFEVTRERIRQIEKRTLRKLSREKHGRSLKDFL